jgi:hypothetical protein
MNDQTGMHYRRFQYNAALASRMEQALPQHLDWCAVVAFYAAMHVLDAYLSAKQFAFPIDSHPNRNRAIRLSPELRRCGTSYREPQEVSEQVRYDPGFQYQEFHHGQAKFNLTKVAAVLEPKIKKLLGES